MSRLHGSQSSARLISRLHGSLRRNDGGMERLVIRKRNRFDQHVSSVFILHTSKFHFHSQDQMKSRILSELFSGFHTRIHDILPILVKFLQVLET